MRSESHLAAIKGAAKPTNAASNTVPGPVPNTTANRLNAAQQHSGIENSDSRGSRTLQSTYFVRTTNANVSGGTIFLYPAGSTNYCMDAGSARPIAGVEEPGATARFPPRSATDRRPVRPAARRAAR